MNKQQKQETVAQLVENVKSSTAMLLADYRGITVAQARELRSQLREIGTTYEVVKNTLMIRAADEAGASELKGLLEGPTAIAFVKEDAPGAAKILVKYAKEFKPLEIKGGILEGQLVDADKIKFLASLPPRDVLIAQLLGTMQGPIRGLATVCAGPIRGLVTALERIKEQKEAA
jgi:large subunit ribosomal protein L10